MLDLEHHLLVIAFSLEAAITNRRSHAHPKHLPRLAWHAAKHPRPVVKVPHNAQSMYT